MEQLNVQSAGVLGDIENDRIEMSRARMNLLDGVLAGNRFVAMSVIPFGRDARAAEPAFRQRLGRRDEHLQQDILAADGDGGILADLYGGLPADFDERVAAVRGRIDLPQYDMAAVFEAVVNAVAHRDYAMHGARIRLHLYADRIELSSPGALPNRMTVDDLAYRQTSRNETLTSLLARCPVPTGIPGLETPRGR